MLEMQNATYTIHFEVFDPNEPVPEQARRLLLDGHNSTLRALVKKAFVNDSVWKYEDRSEVAFFLRVDTRLSIRSQDEMFCLLPINQHEIQFDSHMTNEEFEMHYDEIVRACGLVSDAIFAFTQKHLGYRARPSWRIARTATYV